MASNSVVEFIDAALRCTTPFALSYMNREQKWLIRQQLVRLFREFPSLYPSMDTYNHNDGTTVNLLNASGSLHVSHSSPSIPIRLWLHKDFPHTPPMVHISSPPGYLISRDHPFVDSSGVIASPYLCMWDHSRCNLSNLVHNLIKLFSHNHPFSCTNLISSSTHPSLVSKMEAMDRLSCTLHYDMIALRETTTDEIQDLSDLQVEMVSRVDIATSILLGLEHERTSLKERVRNLTEEADVLLSWLSVHNGSSNAVFMAGDQIEEMFEVVGKDSQLILDGLAEDRAVEDLMYALDKAVEKGVMTFEVYIKQVRSLAREQFFNRAKLQKLKGSQILQSLDLLT